MTISKIRNDAHRVIGMSERVLIRYGSKKVNDIGMSHSDDIESFCTSLILCMSEPGRFVDGLSVFFVYAYMVGQDSVTVQRSDKLTAAKKRLNHLVSTGDIGIYDADQLIDDIRVVLEALK